VLVSVPTERAGPAAERTVCWAKWAGIAQQKYGFDSVAARRLAFARWLHVTHRISDWYETELLSGAQTTGTSLRAQ
jgi:hypothetical protein